MTERHAVLGHRARPRAPARARRARRAPALGEPLRLAARDRRGRVPRAPRDAVRARALAAGRARRDRRGGVVGNVLLGLGGLIGADARVPTMVLLRAPLGRRGSYLPTGLNVVQCLGWSVFELIIIATGASALSQQRLRLRRRRRSGRSSSARRDRARVARPGRLRAQVRAQVRGLGRDRVARSISPGGRCTASTRSRCGTAAARTRSGRASTSCSRRSSAGRRSSPTTRASRARGAAGFWSAGLGYFVPTVPLFALGAVIALSRHISDAPGAPDGDRRRRRRERARAARADRRRERRGVRERLLRRGQPAEPAAARAAAAARRRRRRDRDGRRAR